MRPTLSLINREFTAYFLSPIAYVVLAVFLLVTGHLFYLTLNLLTESGPRGVEFPMQAMLGDEKFWLVFLFIPPLVTMRLFAEERGTGTLEMLMTSPVRDWQVVLSKFIACFLFYLVLWAPTILYWPVLLNLDVHEVRHTNDPQVYGRIIDIGGWVLAGLFFLAAVSLILSRRAVQGLIGFVACAGLAFVLYWYHSTIIRLDAGSLLPRFDPRPVGTSYLGVVLAGAMFLSLGLFVSSLVRSQMVAALVSLILSLLFIVGGFWRPEMDPSSLLYRIIAYVSVPQHFSQNFTRGIIDTGNLVLYVSATLFFLFLTVRSLESRRWK
jgi:ABC-type transport system involved in multi-copper enzyme maturation permease subunit